MTIGRTILDRVASGPQQAFSWSSKSIAEFRHEIIYRVDALNAGYSPRVLADKYATRSRKVTMIFMD